MYGKFTVPTFGWCLWFMSLYILYMDPMCYLPVQRIPGNYRRKKIRKAPKEDNNQKLHKLRWLGFYHVLCASHRLSSVGKFRGLKQARELSTNHWEVWKASKKNARRKPRPFSNLTPKSIQSANLEFHQPGQPTPPKRTPNIGFNRVSYNQ